MKRLLNPLAFYLVLSLLVGCIHMKQPKFSQSPYYETGDTVEHPVIVQEMADARVRILWRSLGNRQYEVSAYVFDTEYQRVLTMRDTTLVIFRNPNLYYRR
ncbi:hypothetical protein SAMN05421823_11942 [Catalinimonas alkaloidigena]|uniref:Uncharacterized protein n=1 Tax=Catalinimonas alkaloidigena TaxID=1075417 RepID=A0A1G9V7L0_9BACT|nr:hypothetical protein [Catalinimonas alkaloidigena]SDM68151.1 hypothetical protein SAMN05421823_11942 [Catalinimonas alkaloidigena]